MNRELILILMAAGRSTRFGDNKLLTIINGKPMYRHVFDHLVCYQQEHPDNCQVIVVSCYDEILDHARRAGFKAVHNPRPEDGISLTIRLGLEAGQDMGVKSTESSGNEDAKALNRQAAIFFTADQPYLHYKSLDAFLQMARTVETGLMSAAHEGVFGNPVSFDQIYFPELQELTGDVGGKRILMAHLNDVTWFEMTPDELLDIDRPINNRGEERRGR